MEQENKNSRAALACSLLAIAVLFAAGLWVALRLLENNSGAGIGTVAGVSALPADTPLAVQALPDGSQTFSDEAYGYSLVAPADWYVEKNGAGGITAYPDYAATATAAGASSSSLACKIELSPFIKPATMSDADWIAGHLAEDPTVEVRENSSEALLVSDDPAIRWDGEIDGVPTALIYVFAPKYVYEIAPSGLDASPDPAQCEPYADLFLGNLTL